MFLAGGKNSDLISGGGSVGFFGGFLFSFFFNFLFIYLFIYGCVGSSFLCEGFL